MRFLFLGTGSAEGIPAFRCSCLCCCKSREKKGKNIRQNASLYIEGDSGEYFLIDCPMHFKARLNDYGIDETLITDLFITHYHEDHTYGLYYIGETTKDNGFIIDSPVKIHMAENTFIKTSSFFDKESMCVRNVISEHETVCIGEFEITALETNHLNRNEGDDNDSFGYLIKYSKTTIVYLVDAAKKLPASTLKELAKHQIDYLIYDCTFNEVKEMEGHSDIEGALNLKDKLNPVNMIITHISHRNYMHDELTEIMKKHGIVTAWDGMEVII